MNIHASDMSATGKWVAAGALRNLLCIGVLLIPCIRTAVAQDWSSCSSELDSLRSRSSDASSAAQGIDDYKRRFDSAKDDYHRCVTYPESYDLMGDHCQSRRSDAESALSRYKSEVNDFASKLDDVDRKVKAVSSACAVEMSSAIGAPLNVPVGVGNPDSCRVYLRYKGQLPLPTLLGLCRKAMPEDQCKKCLGSK